MNLKPISLPTAKQENSSTAEPPQQAAVRVLMVEDDPGYQTFIRQLLTKHRKAKFEFAGVNSIAQCQRYLSLEMADVILLDLNLPDSRGITTVTQVLAISAGAPIVVLTSEDEDSSGWGLEALSLGAQDYLVKYRVSNDSLIRCIRYAIERKKFEESELRLSAITDFISTLAHDLNVPLIGSSNVLTALLENAFGPLSDKQAETLAALKDSNSKQLELVQRLLTLYKYELNSQKLEFEFIDLRKLILQCVESSSRVHNQQIIARLPEILPEVRGDRDALRILFAHLLENAIKYGDREKEIEIRTEQHGASLSIHIHNFGSWISPEMQEGLFKKFWRGIPGKSYVAHTGMGLYLCQRIASLHRGRLSCQSTAESGTTMTVKLPVHC